MASPRNQPLVTRPGQVSRGGGAGAGRGRAGLASRSGLPAHTGQLDMEEFLSRGRAEEVDGPTRRAHENGRAVGRKACVRHGRGLFRRGALAAFTLAARGCGCVLSPRERGRHERDALLGALLQIDQERLACRAGSHARDTERA